MILTRDFKAQVFTLVTANNTDGILLDSLTTLKLCKLLLSGYLHKRPHPAVPKSLLIVLGSIVSYQLLLY